MAIVRGRLGARDAAHMSTSEQVSAIAAQTGHDIPTPKPSNSHATDIHQAARAAEALGAAIVIAARRRIDDARAANVEPSASVIDGAWADVQHRIKRTAATEIARTYNNEIAAEVREIAPAFDDVVPWSRVLKKRWNAEIDRKVCPVCLRMDGTLVLAHESFPGGMEPGEVHPNCRCVSELTWLVDRPTKH